MKDRQYNDKKEKRQKNEHLSTRTTYKTKYRATRTPQTIRGELMSSGIVSSSYSTSSTSTSIAMLFPRYLTLSSTG